MKILTIINEILFITLIVLITINLILFIVTHSNYTESIERLEEIKQFEKGIKCSVFPDFIELNHPFNSTNKRVWICSDIHISENENSKHWSNIISDAISLNTDVSFCNGDMIDFSHNEDHRNYMKAWNNFWYNPKNNYGWIDTYKHFEHSNIIIGNHDPGWKTVSKMTGLNISNKSTYLMGNILFITLSDMYPDPDSFSVDHKHNHSGIYNDYIPWLNNTIQNNQDKNIIVLSHFPIYNTVYGTNSITQMHENPWLHYETNSSSFIDMLEWLDTNNYNISAWISGHTHMSHYTKNFVKKYGTVFINSLVVTSFASEESSSIFLDFQIDSDRVMVQAYSHERQSWLTGCDNVRIKIR